MARHRDAAIQAPAFGPMTLYHMSLLFQAYVRARKLAEHNRKGLNPRFPGKAGEEIGRRLDVAADQLANSFPAFPEAFEKVHSRGR